MSKAYEELENTLRALVKSYGEEMDSTDETLFAVEIAKARAQAEAHDEMMTVLQMIAFNTKEKED